jgi:hypothetical protein
MAIWFSYIKILQQINTNFIAHYIALQKNTCMKSLKACLVINIYTINTLWKVKTTLKKYKSYESIYLKNLLKYLFFYNVGKETSDRK